MAIDRGALLAQTYQLPQAQVQKPVAENPFVDEVGEPASGLQQIDGVTSDYFQKWAALKGFARDVQENLGVDVRFPDPSIPGSDRLHRIYLKSLADLKAQGERLKTGQQQYMADRQRGAIINKDPHSQYYDQLNVGTDIVDSDLDPIVSEANKKLQGPHFGAAINEAKQFRDHVKAILKHRIDSDPQNAGYWQRQMDSLIEPVQAIREFDPNSGNSSRGSVKSAGVFVDKVANMMAGTAKGYKLSSDVFGPNKERVYVNKDMTGITYGGAPITEWQHIPATDTKPAETFIIVGGNRIPLTGEDVVSVAKGLVTENPRLGAEGKFIDQYADEKGYFGDTGEVDPSRLVDPLVVKNTNTLRTKELEKENAKQDANALQELDTQISQLTPSEQKTGVINYLPFSGGYTDDRFIGQTDDGKPVKVVARDSEGKRVYEVENIKDILGPRDNKGKVRDLSRYKKMSKEDLLGFLSRLKVHYQFKNQQGGTTSAPISPKGIDPDI